MGKSTAIANQIYDNFMRKKTLKELYTDTYNSFSLRKPNPKKFDTTELETEWKGKMYYYTKKLATPIGNFLANAVKYCYTWKPNNETPIEFHMAKPNWNEIDKRLIAACFPKMVDES